MPEIRLSDIESHDPDVLLPVEEEFKKDHDTWVSEGKSLAEFSSVAVVGICRNAMPFLPFTLDRIEKLRSHFGSSDVFIYENDSTDGTKECLATWHSPSSGRTAEMTNNGRPHLCYTKDRSRTDALAEYRGLCHAWAVRRKPDWVIVVDMDPWGGFSIDGVLNSIGRMGRRRWEDAAGMASYSWAQWGKPVWAQPTICQYDAWACRPNYWQERKDMTWFHLWHPPVGSEPIRMNSAFGQLAVYKGGRFAAGRYAGGDCEHVPFHRSCGGPIYLNPAQRVVSFWCLEDANAGVDLHGDVHQAVVERNADDGDRRDSQHLGGSV